MIMVTRMWCYFSSPQVLRRESCVSQVLRNKMDASGQKQIPVNINIATSTARQIDMAFRQKGTAGCRQIRPNYLMEMYNVGCGYVGHYSVYALRFHMYCYGNIFSSLSSCSSFQHSFLVQLKYRLIIAHVCWYTLWQRFVF